MEVYKKYRVKPTKKQLIKKCILLDRTDITPRWFVFQPATGVTPHCFFLSIRPGGV